MSSRSFKKEACRGLERRGPHRMLTNLAESVEARRGLTLVEILVAMTLALVTLTGALAVFSGYLGRTTAQRAAQVFARDLVLARSSAVRSREWVVVKFDEAALSYTVSTAAGDEVASRAFGDSSEVKLDSIDLQIVGDSVGFDGKGIADLSGAGGALGFALFAAGGFVYQVSFNGMGASRVVLQ
jgi:prepilin-type N-terminal cleavage/methylation domain-containing protein